MDIYEDIPIVSRRPAAPKVNTASKSSVLKGSQKNAKESERQPDIEQQAQGSVA
jgi:hypothetical protein